ncbi:hypothetical protein E2320_019506, partial [Naja naja]
MDKSQSKRDGGFKNKWSCDHSEESEGDAEKDEANLLIFDESDGTCSPNGERKPCHHRLGFGARNDALRTYSRQNKSDTLGTLKSITTGLNISGSSKKIWCSAFQMISKLFNMWCMSGGNVSYESAANTVQLVNVENISCSDSEEQARRFCPHTQTRVKTAAQNEANLLIFDESDGTCSPNAMSPSLGFEPEMMPWTYSRQNKSDTLGTLKSITTGLNISGSSKKIWCSAFQMISKLFNMWCMSGGNVSYESAANTVQLVNVENISCSDSEEQARRFCPHTQTRSKTAAQ